MNKIFKSAIIALLVPVGFVYILQSFGINVGELGAFLIGFIGTTIIFNYLMLR